MAKNLYIGNLNFDTTQEQLQELFQEYGEVSSAKVITDRETGRSRGFAFVEMAAEEAAAAAIAGLNGQQVDGRMLTVSEAKPRAPRRESRGGGRRGGRSGGRSREWDS